MDREGGAPWADAGQTTDPEVVASANPGGAGQQSRGFVGAQTPANARANCAAVACGADRAAAIHMARTVRKQALPAARYRRRMLQWRREHRDRRRPPVSAAGGRVVRQRRPSVTGQQLLHKDRPGFSGRRRSKHRWNTSATGPPTSLEGSRPAASEVTPPGNPTIRRHPTSAPSPKAPVPTNRAPAASVREAPPLPRPDNIRPAVSVSPGSASHRRRRRRKPRGGHQQPGTPAVVDRWHRCRSVER